MSKATFNGLGRQGISHEVAAANNLGFALLSASAIPNFFNNLFTGYNNISARPD